jgi:hypothetical protein
MRENKMTKVGYTTVFHPGDQGVTIHKPRTFTILTTNQPVLNGSKSKGLWSIATDK